MKRHQIEMTTLSVILWGIFLFFLLAWIFVLGILVGRGFFPGNMSTISDLKEQISRLQQIIRNEDQKGPPGRSLTSEEDPKLAFYEQLSSKKDELNTKTVSDLTKPEEAKVSSAPENAKIENPPPDKEVKEKEQKKISAPVVTTDEKLQKELYTVQIASLVEKDKAEKVIADLISSGYPAYYYETNFNNKLYYRIRCGKFVNKADADKMAKDLEGKKGIKGFVSRLE